MKSFNFMAILVLFENSAVQWRAYSPLFYTVISNFKYNTVVNLHAYNSIVRYNYVQVNAHGGHNKNRNVLYVFLLHIFYLSVEYISHP